MRWNTSTTHCSLSQCFSGMEEGCGIKIQRGIPCYRCILMLAKVGIKRAKKKKNVTAVQHLRNYISLRLCCFTLKTDEFV